jgi:hypothetical protein
MIYIENMTGTVWSFLEILFFEDTAESSPPWSKLFVGIYTHPHVGCR